MNHKFSTYALIFIVSIFLVLTMVIAISSEDIDEVCNQDDSVLYRYGGSWACAKFNQLITVTNMTIINNQTIYNTTTLNVTENAYFNKNVLTNQYLIGKVSMSNITERDSSCSNGYYLTNISSDSCTRALKQTGDTATGDYNFDSDTFVIVSETNRVAVGNADISHKFTITSDQGFGSLTENMDRVMYITQNEGGGLLVWAHNGTAYSNANPLWFIGSNEGEPIAISPGNTANTESETTYFLTNGRIGIHEDNPMTNLQIQHPINSAHEPLFVGDGTYGIEFGSGTSVGFKPMIRGYPYDNNDETLLLSAIEPADDIGSSGTFYIDGRRTNGALQTRPILSIGTYANTKLVVDYNGYMGILTTDPATALEVIGNVTADDYLYHSYEYKGINAWDKLLAIETINDGSDFEKVKHDTLPDEVKVNISTTFYENKVSKLLYDKKNLSINLIPILNTKEIFVIGEKENYTQIHEDLLLYDPITNVNYTSYEDYIDTNYNKIKKDVTMESAEKSMKFRTAALQEKIEELEATIKLLQTQVALLSK